MADATTAAPLAVAPPKDPSSALGWIRARVQAFRAVPRRIVLAQRRARLAGKPELIAPLGRIQTAYGIAERELDGLVALMKRFGMDVNGLEGAPILVAGVAVAATALAAAMWGIFAALEAEERKVATVALAATNAAEQRGDLTPAQADAQRRALADEQAKQAKARENTPNPFDLSRYVWPLALGLGAVAALPHVVAALGRARPRRRLGPMVWE